MNNIEVRLVSPTATEDDFQKYKNYMMETGYHCCFNDKKVKKIKKRKKKPELYNKKGKRIVRAREKWENFSNEDFCKLLESTKKNKQETLQFIYINNNLVGYIYTKHEAGHADGRRIFDFALEPEYQERDFIAQVVAKLKEHIKEDVYVIYATEYAKTLLEGIIRF